MDDLAVTILGFLFLYVILGDNYLEYSISKDLQKLLNRNVFLKRAICFLTIFIFVMLSYFDKGKPKSPLHLLFLTTIIFLLYVISLKAKGWTVVIICGLFFFIYLLDLTRKYYYEKYYKDDLLDIIINNSNKPEYLIFRYLTIIELIVVFIAISLLLKDYFYNK